MVEAEDKRKEEVGGWQWKSLDLIPNGEQTASSD